MKLSCLIADDEPLAHKLLENYAGRLKTLEVTGNAYNAFEVIDFYSEQKADILFLDIDMPGLSGIELLKSIKHDSFVILTTAYPDFSLVAFDLGVIDYLLKPIKFERFLTAIDRIISLRNFSSTGVSEIVPEEKIGGYITVKSGLEQIRVSIDAILFVQAYGNFIKIITQNGTHLIAGTMKGIEDVLSGYSFVRTHKSYIVNISKIRKIQLNKISIDNHVLPIGAVYKLALFNHLKRI
jgi:DNA-binding LytR/AlgR family response regulator